MDLSQAIECANAFVFPGFLTDDASLSAERARNEEALGVLRAAWAEAPAGREPFSFDLVRSLADRNRDVCDRFGIEKLRDVSKNVISRMTAEQVYDYVAEWSAVNDKEFNALLTRDPAFSKAYLAIGRGGKKPRKDLALWSDAKGYMDFMFDELFQPDYTMPERVSAEDAKAILADFAQMFDENDTPDGFFEKMKQIASAHGYAADTKAYKADPSAYKGAVGDVSMVVRVAVAGRQNAPDLQTVMGILGKEKVLERLSKCADAL